MAVRSMPRIWKFQKPLALWAQLRRAKYAWCSQPAVQWRLCVPLCSPSQCCLSDQAESVLSFQGYCPYLAKDRSSQVLWSPFPYKMGVAESINIERDIKCTWNILYQQNVLLCSFITIGTVFTHAFSHVVLTVYLLQVKYLAWIFTI